MPYIKQKDRDKLDGVIQELIVAIKGNMDKAGVLGTDAENLDGVLNYCFFKICKEIYPQKYHWYNRMMGMMECCKAELYRRLVAPYEDIKIEENGDVV